jgi:outer membrane lipoprotein LolB
VKTGSERLVRASLLSVVVVFAIFSIAGCVSNPSALGQNTPKTAVAAPTTADDTAVIHSGRISLVVEAASADAPAQSFAGGFELRGLPPAAQLDISTPLGQTVAQLTWSPGKAELKAGGQVQRYPSAEAMISTLLGIQMPPQVLFDWLSGKRSEAQQAADWQVDLSNYQDGRIIARRSQPTPALLRIILERP